MIKIHQITYHKLPTYVVISEHIRPKYILEEDYKDKQLPAKYNNLYYDFIDGYLCELQENTKVLLNEKEAGKQRILRIGGNDLHRAVYAQNAVATNKVIRIKDCIKEFFDRNQQQIDITLFPVFIEMKFYVREDDQLDHDNLSEFYRKIYLDSIQTERIIGRSRVLNPKGIIPNDDKKYVSGSSIKVFPTNRDPYLIVNFFNYDSPEEYEKDRANIKVDQTIMDKVQKLAENYVNLRVSELFPRGSQFDKHTGELTKEAMKFYQKEFDYYFSTLKNAFL